jgi:hypothetical protein
MRGIALFLLGVACCRAQDADLAPMLDRLAEEAEVFRQLAPKVVAREILVQRAREDSGRGFPIRIGRSAQKPPVPEYKSRQIVSEYGFASLKAGSGPLQEFRQVITVDGRRVATEEKARESLTTGLKSPGDQDRKRMLEQFEKHGLKGAASDFGQLILLFTKRRLGDYEFTPAGEDALGQERAQVVRFVERAGRGRLLIIERSKAIYRPLEGRIWLRMSDHMRLRITLLTTRESEDGITVRDEAIVDYVRSPHGLVVPAAVAYRQFSGLALTVENLYRYSPFRLFAADTEVRFE